MISFKEFLKRKEVLNENLKKDIEEINQDKQLTAIYNWIKNDKYETDIDLSNKNNIKKIIDEINKGTKDEKGKIKIDLSNKDDLKEFKNKFKKAKRVNKNYNLDQNGIDDGDNLNKDELNELIKNFFASLVNETEKLKEIDGNIVRNVLGYFKKNNNADTKIDKEEFFNTIKDIKENYKENLSLPAFILWIAYIRQLALKNKAAGIFSSNDSSKLNNNFTSLLSKIDTEGFFVQKNKDNKFTFTDNYENLCNIFTGFGKFQLDSSILQNFKTVKGASKYLQQDIETIKQKTVGNFTEKTPEEKEAEKQEDKEKQEDEELEKKNNELDAQEEKDGEEKQVEDSTSGILKKRNWYIFNTTPPEAGNDKQLQDFRDKFEQEVDEIFKDVGKEIDNFEVSKKRENDLDDEVPKASVKEMIANCIKKNGMILEDDVAASNFEKYKRDIHGNGEGKNKGIIQATKDGIQKKLDALYQKASSINASLENESNYKQVVKLRTEFKHLFIDYGYYFARDIKNAINKIKAKLEEAKENKNSNDTLEYKTADQKGQEQLDIKKFSNILSGTYDKDTINLARFMLINLLNTFHDSKNVLEQLNKKTFDQDMFDKEIIYAGSSGKVYVPTKPEETQLIGATAYSFPLVKTETFKNPASLLSAAGINVVSLTVDVLKGLKEVAKAQASQAKQYIDAAKALYNLIQSNLKNGSVVTEGLFGPKANEDMSNFVKSINNQNSSQNQNNILNQVCQKLNLENKFEPYGHDPEDIALRQFLKGFTIIMIGDKTNPKEKYVTSADTFKKYDKNFKEYFEKISSPAVNNGAINLNADAVADGAAAGDAAGADDEEDEKTKKRKQAAKLVAGGVPLGALESQEDYPATESSVATQAPKSVVTSANADSTYGDGYRYSKKAKAIKKKLNSTTYTYSPNSKLKIVRRTFD